MSLAMTIFSMIAAWIAVAFALLWGVLRIARRHHIGAATGAHTEARVTTAPSGSWPVRISRARPEAGPVQQGTRLRPQPWAVS